MGRLFISRFVHASDHPFNWDLVQVTYLLLRVNADVLQFCEELSVVPWWITDDSFDSLKCTVEGIFEIVLHSPARGFTVTLRHDVAELTGVHVEIFVTPLKEACCVKTSRRLERSPLLPARRFRGDHVLLRLRPLVEYSERKGVGHQNLAA